MRERAVNTQGLYEGDGFGLPGAFRGGPRTMVANTAARIAIVAGLLLSTSVSAQAPTANSIPPQMVRLLPPSPMPASFIADVPRILNAAQRTAVDARIDAVQDSGYADIGIAILPSIGDYQPYEVGVALYRAWGIGRQDSLGSARRDLGVLLLIVPREIAPDSSGVCWITTGMGAEGVITDAEGGDICREHIIPRLRERDHAGALFAGIDGIVAQMRQDVGLAQTAVPQGSEPARRSRNAFVAALAGGGALVTALLVMLGLWWRRNAPKKCAKCGSRMHRLAEEQDDLSLDAGQRVEERLGSVDYDVWQCACGEEMLRPHKAIFSRYHACPACKVRAARTTRRVIVAPTYTSTGRAEDTEHCEHCKRTEVKEMTLPRKTPPAESGSRGGGGRSSGGGGRSFGGSGRTSGGGGGGRY